MRIKILILSLILILTIFIPCYAVDESGNVLTSSFSFDCSYFQSFTFSSELVTGGITSDFSSNFYNKMYYDPFVTFSGNFSNYNFYYVSLSSSLNDFKYISLNVDVGALSPNVLITFADLIFFTGEYNYFSVPLDVSSISVNYNGLDFTATNLTYILDISSLDFDISLLESIWVRYDFRTSVDYSSPFLMAPLTLDFYKNYQDVIVDVNSNVQELVNQNNIIINNLDQVNQKLDNIVNAGPSEKEEESFNNELSKDNELHESYKNLENSYLNDVQSGLDVSIDYDISQFKDNLSGILGNSVITGFLGYLYSNPFIVVCFLVLPLFWLVYLVIFRG